MEASGEISENQKLFRFITTFEKITDNSRINHFLYVVF